MYRYMGITYSASVAEGWSYDGARSLLGGTEGPAGSMLSADVRPLFVPGRHTASNARHLAVDFGTSTFRHQVLFICFDHGGITLYSYTSTLTLRHDYLSEASLLDIVGPSLSGPSVMPGVP